MAGVLWRGEPHRVRAGGNVGGGAAPATSTVASYGAGGGWAPTPPLGAGLITYGLGGGRAPTPPLGGLLNRIGHEMAGELCPPRNGVSAGGNVGGGAALSTSVVASYGAGGSWASTLPLAAGLDTDE